MSEWWRDQQLWRDLGPFLFSEAILSTGEGEVEELIDELEPPDGGRILDVGCGLGRLQIPLVKRGYDVVGLELCAEYRRQARARAVRFGVELEIKPQDVFGYDLEEGQERFDAVLDVFAVLGYSSDPLADIVLAQKFRTLLKSGGEVFIQTRIPQLTTGNVQHKTSSGGLCIEVRSYDQSSRTMFTRWTVCSRRGNRQYTTAVRVYTRDDLKGLLEFVGFEDVRTYESVEDERLTVVGMNPTEIAAGTPPPGA